MGKKRINKKAILFSFGLLFTLILALLRVFFLVHTRLGELNEESGYSIGSNQLKIYEAIHNSEKSQLYGEEGFSLAIQQALYDVSSSGGRFQSTSCGESYVWRKNSTLECYPDIEGVKSEIEKSALESLKKKYLASNPYSDMKGTDKIDYDMFLEQKGDRFIARAYPVNPTVERVICNYGKPPLFVFDAVFKPSAFGYAIPGATIGGEISIPNLFAKDMTGICGFYAYRPAFRKELDFDINDFREASQQAEDFADEVVNCKQEGKSVKLCINERMSNYPKLGRDCAEGPAKVFSRFVNLYTRYLSSTKSDCVAYINPPSNIEVDQATTIRIKVMSQGGQTIIEAEDYNLRQVINTRGPYLTEAHNDPDNPSELRDEIQYVITYDKNGKLTNQELNFGSGSLLSRDWDLPGYLLLYKESASKIAFIDTDNHREFDSVPACLPQVEDTFEFCYDTGKKAIAFDEENQKMGLQNLKITFALSFPDE